MSEELKIEWQIKNFSELSLAQLEAVFQLRQQVFIIEQNCPYPDIDGRDQEALHLFGWNDNQLAATARIFPAFAPYNNLCSIGRICTHADYRRFGIGREMMRQLLKYCDSQIAKDIKIGAQLYLKAFYSSFGFEQCSEPYDEDGIMHILMLRKLPED